MIIESNQTELIIVSNVLYIASPCGTLVGWLPWKAIFHHCELMNVQDTVSKSVFTPGGGRGTHLGNNWNSEKQISYMKIIIKKNNFCRLVMHTILNSF